MFDRVGAGVDREADAIGAVRVHRDFLAEHMRGFDDRPRLVVEHLLAEARADAAVDPAGRGEFDHVGAAPDLEPHRAAAVVGAVAGVARPRQERSPLVALTPVALNTPRHSHHTGTGPTECRPRTPE